MRILLPFTVTKPVTTQETSKVVESRDTETALSPDSELFDLRPGTTVDRACRVWSPRARARQFL